LPDAFRSENLSKTNEGQYIAVITLLYNVPGLEDLSRDTISCVCQFLSENIPELFTVPAKLRFNNPSNKPTLFPDTLEKQPPGSDSTLL
jgi:hypothetical protein